MKAKRVSQNAPDRSQTPGPEPRTASGPPETRQTPRAAMSKSRNKRVPWCICTPRRNAAGQPKSIASVMEDEVKEPSAPAFPQEGHTSEDTSAAVESVLQRAAEQAQRSTQETVRAEGRLQRLRRVSCIHGMRVLRWVSNFNTLDRHQQLLGYALENGVDAIGSVLVCGGSGAPVLSRRRS